MNALAFTRGQVHNVILVPGYIKATQCMAVDNFQSLGGLNDWGWVREGACPLLLPERGFGGAL